MSDICAEKRTIDQGIDQAGLAHSHAPEHRDPQFFPLKPLELTIEKSQLTAKQSPLTGTESEHPPPGLQHLGAAFDRWRRDDLHQASASEMIHKKQDATFSGKVLVMQDASIQS